MKYWDRLEVLSERYNLLNIILIQTQICIFPITTMKLQERVIILLQNDVSKVKQKKKWWENQSGIHIYLDRACSNYLNRDQKKYCTNGVT